jgi:hypothetical protein
MIGGMNHSRRMVFGLVLLSAMAFLLARSFPAPSISPEQSEQPTPPSKPVNSSSPVAEPSLPRPTAPTPVTASPGRRLPLPARAPTQATEDSGDALPERGHLAADTVLFSPEAIIEATRIASPDIEACVDEWLSTSPLSEALDGRLVMEVVLSPDGVEEASLLDVEGVPARMLGCFGGVIYEVEWPRPEERTTIRMPFVLTDAEP